MCGIAHYYTECHRRRLKTASQSVLATCCILNPIQWSLIIIDVCDGSPTVYDKLNSGSLNRRTVCDKNNRAGSLYEPSTIYDYHRWLKRCTVRDSVLSHTFF